MAPPGPNEYRRRRSISFECVQRNCRFLCCDTSSEVENTLLESLLTDQRTEFQEMHIPKEIQYNFLSNLTKKVLVVYYSAPLGFYAIKNNWHRSSSSRFFIDKSKELKFQENQTNSNKDMNSILYIPIWSNSPPPLPNVRYDHLTPLLLCPPYGWNAPPPPSALLWPADTTIAVPPTAACGTLWW